MNTINPGKAYVEPSRPVTAGSYITLRYTYTAGHPIDDSGYIKIAFRFAGDFGVFQFTDPEKQNYCGLSTDGDCRLIPRWDPKGNLRPWGNTLYIKITGGFLNTGESINLVIGDTTGGSPGWKAQTFAEGTFEFKTYADPIATYRFKELPESPAIQIVPGRPVKPVLIAPSEVTAGQSFSYFLKREDHWGNPTGEMEKLHHSGFSSSGIERISLEDSVTGLPVTSNPIRIKEKTSEYQPFWADLHGQSEETIGTNTIEEYFTFARDKSLLDICAHQGNDFQVTDSFWDKINKTAQEFYEPGSFVTFPGYEWSGNTPLGGDRNVYYKESGGIISRSCRDLIPGEKSVYPDSPTAAELFKNLKGPSPFSFAHVGGRFADITMHDPEVEIAAEIHSAWGTFEWLIDEAFDKGYRVGICANSDGHKGRPGASYPGDKKFGSYGGLTCVLADKLDRDSVYDALKNRRFYATTGSRILLDVSAEAPDGKKILMGSEGTYAPGMKLFLDAAAAGPLEKIEIRSGKRVLKTIFPEGNSPCTGKRVKVVWSGAEVKGRARMAVWDGTLSLTGNSIENFDGINFWNPEKGIERKNKSTLAWASITTGSDAGCVLILEKPGEGNLAVDTQQKSVSVPVESLKREAKIWDCGGLRKELSVYCLPDAEGPTEWSGSIDLENLQDEVNPIYVKILQEDGHKAWSSPIYLR